MQPRQTKLEARRETSGPPIIPGWVWRGGWVDDSVPSERIVARSVRIIDRDETLFRRKELSRLFRFRVEYEKGHKRNLWFDYRDINLMQISVANSFYSTSNFFPPRISIQLKLDASSLFRVFVIHIHLVIGITRTNLRRSNISLSLPEHEKRDWIFFPSRVNLKR